VRALPLGLLQPRLDLAFQLPLQQVQSDFASANCLLLSPSETSFCTQPSFISSHLVFVQSHPASRPFAPVKVCFRLSGDQPPAPRFTPGPSPMRSHSKQVPATPAVSRRRQHAHERTRIYTEPRALCRVRCPTVNHSLMTTLGSESHDRRLCFPISLFLRHSFDCGCWTREMPSQICPSGICP